MKDFLRHNGILILIIAVLLGLITALVSMFLGGTANPVANLAGLIATPVRNGVDAVVNWTEERYNDAFERENLREENERLKRENAQLRAQQREAEAALRDNERLRNEMGLREKRRDFVYEDARVTGRSTSNWEDTLTLSKGENAGISAGDCVVDEYGNLVGIISKVGVNWSTLITVVDSDLEMGGLLARTDDAAILEGDFSLMGEGRLKLTYLPEGSELIAGDMVLTSGLGGEYPSGLVVGHIEEVLTDPTGMTRYAVVVPETDFNSLKQVLVIKEFDIVE